MKLLIISPGKAHDSTVAEGIAEYEKRLSKALPIEWALPKPSDKDTECEALLKLLRDDDYVVLLDERGRDIDTAGLAKRLDMGLQSGLKRLVFIIGGAYGVNDSVRERAQTTLKLSSLTFPHMLVRLILAEQLYRAHSILAGGKYHHA